jgi:sensor histidine kinase YesM
VIGNSLRMTVADTGPGLQGRPLVQRRYDNRSAGHTVSTGLGLANIRDRLAQAYAEDHRFEILTPPEGGFTVIIEMPYEVYQEPGAVRAAPAKPSAAPAVTNLPGQRAMGTNA